MDKKVYTRYRHSMARGKSPHHVVRVLGTRELREQLPRIMRSAREEGAKAEPIVGGANREPEVVVIPYERYVTMMDDLDNLAIQALYRERVEGSDGLAGRSLEDAARELGFDPDELLGASDSHTRSGEA